MDEPKKPKAKKKAKKTKPAANPVVAVAARYWNEVTSITADASGHQLGSGGLFVATDEAPELGTLFDFEMSVGGEPPITGVVEVVEVVGPRSTDDAQGALGAGMRVKYVHLEDEERARDVLGKMTIAQTASVAPPPSADAEDAPRSSKESAVWDRAVALEDEFFDRASREPRFVPDDAVAEAMEVRLLDPAFIERQQRLRRTFGAVVAVFAILFAVTAVRTMSAREVRTGNPAAAAPTQLDAEPTATSASPPAPATIAPDAPPPLAPSAAGSAAPDAKETKVEATEKPEPEKVDEKKTKSAPPAVSAPSAVSAPPAAQRRPPATRSRSAAPPSRSDKPATKGGGDSIYE